MRKGLILSLMAMLLVMSPIRILADSATPEPETEQIEDEEAPQAARRNQDSALLFAFLAAGILVIAAAFKTKNQTAVTQSPGVIRIPSIPRSNTTRRKLV